jgi:hypothetical protein
MQIISEGALAAFKAERSPQAILPTETVPFLATIKLREDSLVSPFPGSTGLTGLDRVAPSEPTSISAIRLTTTMEHAMAKVVSRRGGARNPGAIYVGRPSKWGNPFQIGRDGTREEVIAKYERWLNVNPLLKRVIVAELRGRDLECWCSPLPCHADLLLQLANS